MTTTMAPSPPTALVSRAVIRMMLIALLTWGAALAAVSTSATVAIGGALGGMMVIASGCAVRRTRASRAAPATSARLSGYPWPIIVIVGCAAALIACGQVWAAQPSRTALSDREGVIRGQVTVTSSVSSPWPGAWQFDGDARVDGGEHGPVVVVFVGERSPDVSVGAIVDISGTADQARPGERAVIRIMMRTEPTVISRPSGVYAIASTLRSGLIARSAVLPGEGAQLLPGLAVGDTIAVTESLDSAMKASSLSHLTAVSGSNCAIVVGAAFALAALCGCGRRIRVAVALTTLAGFVVLVTPEPSVVRAAAMSSVAMMALLLGRARAGAAVLCTAVTIVLCVDPWLASSIGFVLSVAATGALLVLAAPLTKTLSRVVPIPLAMVIALPLAAQLACAPILILLTPAISTWGVLANIVAAPAAPIATVLGLIACLGAGIPGVGAAVAALAWVPAQWVGSTAVVFAALPAAQVPWIPGLVGTIALTVVSVAIAALLVGTTRPGVRLSAITILAIATGIIGGTWGVRAVVLPSVTPQEWSIAMCDVGQGDALMLRSAGRTVLIDTGPDPARLGDCLDRLRVGRIAVLVLTHFDADHAGGVSAVRGRVDVVMHGPAETAEQHRILSDARDARAQTHAAVPGETLGVGTGILRVLWPAPVVTTAGNDASVVVEWSDGDIRALFLADTTAESQQKIMASDVLRPPYGVVKVAHHGSADQWPRLYQELGAAVALVPVGADNDYGHPRQVTLDLLASLGTATERSDRAGLVLVSGEEGQIRVWREHGDR